MYGKAQTEPRPMCTMWIDGSMASRTTWSRTSDADGAQDSTVSVFTQDDDGTLRHIYTSHPRMDDDIDQRGIDLLSPVWHVLDLTSQGRGDCYAQLEYQSPAHA
jgi:predicted dithiol-disulfide oxidoreductase (DUF899 family)